MLTELVRIAEAGGQLALDKKNDPPEITQKSAGSWNYATQVDPMVEELIIDQLGKSFPGIAIIGEEQDKHHLQGDTFFTVDPIDGTIPYSNGFPNWGTIIGFVKDGQPQAGVIILPELKIKISAQRGHGCYINDQLVQLDYPRALADTVVAVEIGPWIPSNRWPALSALRTKCLWLGGSGFVAACIADLLLGKAGAYPNFRAKIWDFSASAIIITEAGGVACQLNGQPLTWDQIDMQALFFANDRLASEVLPIINTN